MTNPTWIRPWYWRLPFRGLEWLAYHAPRRLRIWAYRIADKIVDRYGPFGPGRGYWVVVNDENGRRLERSPDVPRNYAIEPEALEEPNLPVD